MAGVHRPMDCPISCSKYIFVFNLPEFVIYNAYIYLLNKRHYLMALSDTKQIIYLRSVSKIKSYHMTGGLAPEEQS